MKRLRLLSFFSTTDKEGLKTLTKWLRIPAQACPILVIHIFPSRHTQGFQFKLHKRSLQSICVLFCGLFLYLCVTSGLVLKNEYQLWTLQHQNTRLANLMTDYEKNLSDFSIAVAPQVAYIENQLGSWQKLRPHQETLAIGGGGSDWDNSHSLELYKEALAEKQKLILETPDIADVLKHDFTTLEQNYRVMKNLYHEIAEHKQFLSALPLNWPVLGGWGEIISSQQQKESSSALASRKKRSQKHPFYVTSDESQLILKVLPGTPILTTANGTVYSVTYRHDNPLAVNIIIKHDYGIETLYEGVQNSTVQKDDVVTKRQALGISTDVLTYKIKLAKRFVPPEEYAFLRY